MFERFTRQARSVVTAAVASAGDQGAERIGAEHLLLGIVAAAEPNPAAAVLEDVGVTRQALEAVIATEDQDARLLAKLGIDLDEVKQRVERSFGEGSWARRSGRQGHIPFTPDAKKALELSLRHALALKSRTIEAGHILLGVLDSGVTVRDTLHAVGVEPLQVKRRLLEVMRTAS
jgi:ATP-dependent Clp protease ATP-binding subunit ClpA